MLGSAKRKKAEKIGVSAWHPYYAGYSSQFVNACIDYLKLKSNDVILDPWHGSGTTGFVAQQREISCIGIEINPVIAHFAAAKSNTNIHFDSSALKFLSGILSAMENHQVQKTSLELQELIGPCAAENLFDTADLLQSHPFAEVSIASDIQERLQINEIYNNPVKSFLLAAFFRSARDILSYQGQSNPTWVGIVASQTIFSRESLATSIKAYIENMRRDLIFDGAIRADKNRNVTLLGNSKKLPLIDESISAVITSPPYLTRIDYAMATKLELLLISSPATLRKTRELTTGAPIILKSTPHINSNWGDTCIRFLHEVKNHPTKAADTYYLKNFLQYFDDIFFSLLEIKRVLRKNAHALVVIQSSYFKDLYIDLTKIYQEMGNNLEMQTKVVSSEAVKGHLAHVNTKSSVYVKNKSYTEDVVEFKKI